MSLLSTLARVAVGVAVAKGVSHIARNGMPGGSPDRRTADAEPGGAGGAGHGLDDMMGQILGGGSRGRTVSGQQPSSGGGLLEGVGGALGGMFGGSSRGGMSGGSGSGGGMLGGLGSLLNQFGNASPSQRRGQAPGGIGDLLGSLTGGAAGGGLGAILGNLFQGGPSASPAAAPRPEEEEVAAALVISAMVQAAKCDGTLDDDERQKLMAHMGDAEPKEVKFVNDLLKAPVDVDGLVLQVPRGMEEQVYVASLMAIDLDSQAETDYLQRLSSALGLDRERVNEINRTAGAEPLYT